MEKATAEVVEPEATVAAREEAVREVKGANKVAMVVVAKEALRAVVMVEEELEEVKAGGVLEAVTEVATVAAVTELAKRQSQAIQWS